MQITSFKNGIYKVTVPIVTVKPIQEKTSYDMNNDISFFTKEEKKQLGIKLSFTERIAEKYQNSNNIITRFIGEFK